MIEWIKRWWTAIAGVLGALVWLLFELSHQKKSERAKGRADEVDADIGPDLFDAYDAQQKAEKHESKAVEARKKGDDAVKKVKESSHESLADRVDAYRDRVRNRT